MIGKLQIINISLILILNGINGFPDITNEWELWKTQYGKTYESDEVEKEHLAIWKENLRYVKEHNRKESVSFKLETNHLSDKRYPVRQNLDTHYVQEEHNGAYTEVVFAPASWDWRTKGAVSPVMNQGMLSDVQAIVAAECVESFQFIQSGDSIEDVSVAEVHDCCTPTPISSTKIFQCIHNIGGLCTEADYPQIAHTCRNNTCSPVAKVNGGNEVPHADETAMMEAVYKTPVMALVDASHPSFQMYRSGIYTEPSCKSIELDHVLQVVGYGSEGGDDYWICKNSWGTNWGMNGYINIARNKGNMCGIASMTTYPV